MDVVNAPGYTAKINDRAMFRWAMRQTKHRTDGGPDCSSIGKLALAADCVPATIGFLWTDGKSARDTCSIEVAKRIAAASGVPFGGLFTVVPKSEARKDRAA